MNFLHVQLYFNGILLLRLGFLPDLLLVRNSLHEPKATVSLLAYKGNEYWKIYQLPDINTVPFLNLLPFVIVWSEIKKKPWTCSGGINLLNKCYAFYCGGGRIVKFSWTHRQHPETCPPKSSSLKVSDEAIQQLLRLPLLIWSISFEWVIIFHRVPRRVLLFDEGRHATRREKRKPDEEAKSLLELLLVYYKVQR